MTQPSRPRRTPDKRASGNSQGTHPRWGFIVLALIAFIIGTVLVLQNYSNNSFALNCGLLLWAAAVVLGLFGPSRRRNPPPNGNHGRA